MGTEGTYLNVIHGFLFLLVKESEVAQTCPTLCYPKDYSLSGSSDHGISQARILEWVAISFSRASSWPRDWTWVSHIAGGLFTIWATKEDFLVAQLVKNPPAMQDLVWFLGWEDPLEEGMATHSSILGWRIPWIEEPGGLQSIGSQRVRHDWSDLACTHYMSDTFKGSIQKWTKRQKFLLCMQLIFYGSRQRNK